MKQIVCEICNGTDLVKRDGIFVCRDCGAKYSIEETKKLFVDSVVSQATAESTGLMRRATLFLEDGDFDRADEICEQLLNTSPENAEIYLIKLMAQLHVSSFDQLVALTTPFDSNNTYQKIMRFGSEELKARLQSCIDEINTRNENARCSEIYLQAKEILDCSTEHEKLVWAAEAFESIANYADSSERKTECIEKAECCRQDKIYNSAITEMQKGTSKSTKQAADMFKSICGWRDSEQLMIKCREMAPELKLREDREREEATREAENKRIAAQARKKKTKKILGIVIPLAIIFNTLSGLATCALGAEIGAEFGYYSYKLMFSSTKHYDIPYGTTKINDLAFNACFGLESVTIPDSVTSIGAYAFNGCSSLTEVVIPNSVTRIDDCAFAGCTSLQQIVIPDSVTEMGYMVFPVGTSLTIYCEAEREPSDWPFFWNSGATVIWGYDG